VAFVELQEIIEAPPAIIEAGAAVTDTVGEVVRGVTLTVADCVMDPLEPVHVRENVALLVKGPVLCEPETAFVPDQSPKAVHDEALAELHEIMAEAPELTESGSTVIASVGVGVGVVPLTLLI
jgi:hypothetical protein